MKILFSAVWIRNLSLQLIPFITLFIFPCIQINCQVISGKGNVFSRNNLVAWCIVPFDIKKRGAEERAQMLDKLGISKFAYDWRDEHVPLFDKEMEVLKSHHLVLQAFWMPYGPNPTNNKHYDKIMSLLKRHNLQTQLWWSYGSNDAGLKNMTQVEKVITIANMVKNMAEDALAIGCKVGLYGHGGWFGEPENQLAILTYLKMKNVGIVYNFNHAEEQIDRFPEFFPALVPKLIALNIAGLKKGPPGKVVIVGQGDSEEKMIRIIAESGYQGPIGVINEDSDPDAEIGLSMNMGGVKKIVQQLGYDKAAKTYH